MTSAMSSWHVHRVKLQLFGPDETHEAGDHLVEPLDLGRDDIEVLSRAAHLGRRFVAAVEPQHRPHGRARVALQPQQVLAHELEMDGHGVQRVSDFMRDAGHEAAERARRQLLTDGPKRFPDSFELFVRRQVDAADLFAAPQLHEAAVDDVNGAKDAGRQHQADEDGRR